LLRWRCPNFCQTHPFLWDQGKLVDLYTSTVGGNPITANAINDAGEILGAAAFPAEPHDAYLWRDGLATDLGHLNGDCSSEGWAMNSARQIVGISSSCDGTNARAALWENGSLVDLNTLIPPGSDLQLLIGYAINDRGEIGGLGLPSGCSPQIDELCGRAFVLIPCDDDHRDVEGCDYDMVAGSDMPATQMATTAKPVLSPDSIRQLMQSASRRSKPWYRGFRAQTQPK
jgi:probable HAF family extracellular repeat protein